MRLRDLETTDVISLYHTLKPISILEEVYNFDRRWVIYLLYGFQFSYILYHQKGFKFFLGEGTLNRDN